MTNKRAIACLERFGISNSDYIIRRLIEADIIEADQESTPERYARAAKEWIGSSSYGNAFTYASGWSTGSWEYVLRDKLDDPDLTLEHDIQAIKDIFAAVVILAKEAGVEL